MLNSLYKYDFSQFIFFMFMFNIKCNWLYVCSEICLASTKINWIIDFVFFWRTLLVFSGRHKSFILKMISGDTRVFARLLTHLVVEFCRLLQAAWRTAGYTESAESLQSCGPNIEARTEPPVLTAWLLLNMNITDSLTNVFVRWSLELSLLFRFEWKKFYYWTRRCLNKEV